MPTAGKPTEATLNLAQLPLGPGPAPDGRGELRRLWSATQPLELARGEYLYLPGDMARSVFLVRAGSARLARLQDSGGELTLDVAGPGDVIGEGAAFGETRRSGLAQALERLRVAPLAVSVLHAALRRRPDWALALGRVVLERSRRLEERATLNALGDCRRRLIGVLLELAERFGQPEPGGCRLGVRVTHEDLARLIGAARETVTPLLVELRRRGWIDYDRRRLVIREREALRGCA